MASVFAYLPVIAVAGCVLAGGVAIGWPAAGLLETEARARWLIAPVIGLALFGVLGAVAFKVLPFTRLGIGVVGAGAWGVSALLGRAGWPPARAGHTVGWGWLGVAVALALVPAFANAPHWHDGVAVTLGKTMFDHGKIAVIDAMLRSGFPPPNPYFQEAGSANLLNYYYLWYAVAAAGAKLAGATGWEADVAFTGLTALLTLTSLAWGAMQVAGDRAAAWWVLAVACAGSMKVAIALLFQIWLGDYMVDSHPLETLGEQASWVPQHVFAAIVAMLAVFAIVAILRAARWMPGASLLAGALVGASYDSSVWVGGLALAAVLPCLSLIGLWRTPAAARAAAVLNLTTIVIAAASCAAVFILRNLAILGQRKTIGFWSFAVLDGNRGEPTPANEIAFWVLRLPVDFGFVYVMSLVWLAGLGWRVWRGRPSAGDDAGPTVGLIEIALALTFLVPLLLAQHVQSVIANNDLGWRIVLLAVFAMTILSATTAVRLATGRGRPFLGFLTILLLVPGIVAGAYVIGTDNWQSVGPGNRLFVERAALWKAVRDVTPPDQAVLNNPDDLAELTRWPGNMSWALLSDRRSCVAGRQWLLSMAPQLLPPQLQVLDAQVKRVFAGTASTEDFRAMAQDHLCSTIVLVPQDGAWSAGLADSPYYAPVAARDGAWRIYRWRTDRTAGR